MIKLRLSLECYVKNIALICTLEVVPTKNRQFFSPHPHARKLKFDYFMNEESVMSVSVALMELVIDALFYEAAEILLAKKIIKKIPQIMETCKIFYIILSHIFAILEP